MKKYYKKSTSTIRNITKKHILDLSKEKGNYCELCNSSYIDSCLITKNGNHTVETYEELKLLNPSFVFLVCQYCIDFEKHSTTTIPEIISKEQRDKFLSASNMDSLSPKLEKILRRQLLLNKKESLGSCEDCFKKYTLDRHYSFHLYYKNIEERDRDPLTMSKYIIDYTTEQFLNELEKCNLYCSSCYFSKLMDMYGDDKLWKVISICERMSKQSC